MEWIELEGNSNSGTSTAFLKQLRERHLGPLKVIWDNAPAHRSEAVRDYLTTPGLCLRLVRLPGIVWTSLNPDETVRGRVGESLPRENGGSDRDLCLRTKALVQSLPRRGPGRWSAPPSPGWPDAKMR